MRFLVDECLSIRLAQLLTVSGHDAVHVVERGLAGCVDEMVLSTAAAEGRILVSADTDFGELLARSGDQTPSVNLFRLPDRQADSLAALLDANLDLVADDLEAGAFVVVTEGRLRIRKLPMA